MRYSVRRESVKLDMNSHVACLPFCCIFPRVVDISFLVRLCTAQLVQYVRGQVNPVRPLGLKLDDIMISAVRRIFRSNSIGRFESLTVTDRPEIVHINTF